MMSVMLVRCWCERKIPRKRIRWMTHESKTPNTHASVVDFEKGIEWLPEIDLELSEDAIESVRC
jgi:hypothetical protein